MFLVETFFTLLPERPMDRTELSSAKTMAIMRTTWPTEV